MRRRTRAIFISLVMLAALMCFDHPAGDAAQSAAREFHGIRYDVSAFKEQDGRRELLSETTIEGPAGTDFEIKLQSARFAMRARFLNDLTPPNALRMRADLNTRRLYGQSERNLPLYEEDTQNQTFQVGFDEKLVLLPFGRNEGGQNSGQLKIEITPSISEQSARLESGASLPLEIKILKASPGNSITVEATKSPHRFTINAALFEDGREVASGTSDDNLIEEASEILLKPNGQASAEVSNNLLAVRLSVDQYWQRRPSDQVAVSFDIYRLGNGQKAGRESIASQWSGVGFVNSTLSYDIGDYYLKATGRKYELKFVIKPARVEDAD